MYGRITDGAVTLWHDGPMEGFYPIVLNRWPIEEPPEGYHYESAWEQREDSIVQIYELVSEQLTPEEALTILLGEEGSET